MDGLIEVLSQRPEESGIFTVDLAADSVEITIPNPGGELRSPDELNFQYGDNLLLLSVGLYLPLSFELWPLPENNPVEFNIYTTRVSDDQTFPFDDLFSFHYPFINYELSMNKFLKMPDDMNASGWRVNLQFNSGVFVSMLGVDASLDTLEFRAIAFAKVLHTLPMFNG